MPASQRLVAECRDNLDKHHRWRRRQIMRDQVLQEVISEFREFVLEFELDSGGKECRAFQEPTDQRIDAVLQEATEALRDAGIFICEFARLLVE